MRAVGDRKQLFAFFAGGCAADAGRRPRVSVAPRRVLCVGVAAAEDEAAELDAGTLLAASDDAALLELAGCDDALAGGTLELAGGVETLCGREDELSSFEHAANSTAAQSAGANSFHTVFFTTKHFLSLWGIPLFVIRPAGTKYFIFPHVLRKFHKTQTKRGEARPPRFVLICPGLAPAHGSPWACPQCFQMKGARPFQAIPAHAAYSAMIFKMISTALSILSAVIHS